MSNSFQFVYTIFFFKNRESSVFPCLPFLAEFLKKPTAFVSFQKRLRPVNHSNNSKPNRWAISSLFPYYDFLTEAATASAFQFIYKFYFPETAKTVFSFAFPSYQSSRRSQQTLWLFRPAIIQITENATGALLLEKL